MDLNHARKIAEKLENNLNTLQKSADFINDTHKREGTFGKHATHGVFTSLKQALIVYLECDSDKDKLENFIQSMEEIAANPPESYGFDTVIGNSLIDLINAPYVFSREEKYVSYSTASDRILKEIEAQLGVLCNEFSIEKPKDVSSGEPFSGFESNLKRLERAFNVVNAVKSITD